MKITDEQLTLWEIADHLSRGSAAGGQPVTREEAFQELIRAVLRREFEDKQGNSDLRIYGVRWGDDGADTSRSFPWSVRMLLCQMRLRKTPRTRRLDLPPRARLDPTCRDREAVRPTVSWSTLKNEIPWEELDALKLEDFEPQFRRVYLERLSIGRANYHRWARASGSRTGQHLPDFWSDSVPVGESALAGEAAKPKRWKPGPTGHKEMVLTRFEDRIAKGAVLWKVIGEAIAIRQSLLEDGYSEEELPQARTIENVIRKRHRAWRNSQNVTN